MVRAIICEHSERGGGAGRRSGEAERAPATLSFYGENGAQTGLYRTPLA